MSYTCGLNFFEFPHQLPGDGFRIRTTGFANPEELNHIQPTFTQFQSANQIALAFQPSGQLPLIQSGLAPQFQNGFAKALTLTGVDGFIHARIMRAGFGCTQNASVVSCS